MKNTELFDLLGEIDDRFFDEVLGGDTEKPLKIDTSRRPAKWYRIATSIAACLMLGVGVVILANVINRPSLTPPDPDSSGYTSTGSGYYAEYPVSPLDKIPTFTDTGSAENESSAKATLAVAKLGNYDVCLAADSVFRLAERSDRIYAKKVQLILVENGKQLSSASFLWESVLEEPHTYAFDRTFSNISVDVFELSGAAAAAVRYRSADTDKFGTECSLIGIKDEKAALMYGTDILGLPFASTVSLSDNLSAVGNSLFDNDTGREYRFNVDTFNDDPNKTPHFTTHFCGVTGTVLSELNGGLTANGSAIGTEKELNYWKSLIKNANVSRIEIAFDPDKTVSEITVAPKRAAAILDALAAANVRMKGKPLANTANGSANTVTISAYGADGSNIFKARCGSGLSVLYDNSGTWYEFDTSGIDPNLFGSLVS